MGLRDYLSTNLSKTFAPIERQAIGGGLVDKFQNDLDQMIQLGGMTAVHARAVKDAFESARQNTPYSALSTMVGQDIEGLSSVGGLVGINDYGVKGKRQYIAERRRLLDLYVIAYNVADIRTAVTHLRNEIFRRGIIWKPKFDFKCDDCGKEYTKFEATKAKGVCSCRRDGQRGAPKKTTLRKPDYDQVSNVEKFMEEANYFQQSLEAIMRECEDDINIVDDAFLYMRKRYAASELDIAKWQSDKQLAEMTGTDDPPAPVINQEVLALFRLDPTLIEYDMDARGVPGMAHHICVFHRDELLAVPPDQGWDVHWRGECPSCGMITFPVYYKYSEQQSGAYGAATPQTLYLIKDEVIHWSRYAPSETFGYPPILSIYEKALTLIGMDRYLYDYFYERRVPQGAITVVTDDTEGFKATKAEVEAKMAANPHYIPWMAISSKTGQGGMQFVRFAYSLDELNYLPVRDEIRERISGLFGVSAIWMQDTSESGGLNNESQQLVVMSRVVESAQRSYHSDVFPKIEAALGVSDFTLFVQTPEEATELKEIEVYQARATLAQTMAAMGFGVNLDDPESFQFSYYGKIKSMEEREKEQQGMANPFGAPAGPDSKNVMDMEPHNPTGERSPSSSGGSVKSPNEPKQPKNPVPPPKAPNRQADTRPSAGFD